ncbi:hypothetical protein [Streptomyces sp. NPDC058657]|uniref:hypothetical protein n=1 Tax=unclassified Streptomyces TaxID=2593676 RepID=UPI003662A40B
MPPVVALARHFYETRREILVEGGTEATPWYRLTEDSRAIAVAEAHIVLEAVRRANDEQKALLTVAALRLHESKPPSAVV